MTSADSIRLWSIGEPSGDGQSVVGPDPAAPAVARTLPTVTQSLEKHLETVYRYELRLAGRADLAEDLTQETLLRAWRSRHKLREPDLMRVWLLRITTNLWTDQLRRVKFHPRVLEHEPPCPRPSPCDVADESERVQMALAAMDDLPPRQRQVLYLVTCEQLSQAEVADVLGTDLPAVKENLSLARKEMRRRLKTVYEAVCHRPASEGESS